jgi:uncharacterized protein
MRTDERVWLITGASSGFGRAIAEAALARGDSVVAASRRTESLRDLGPTERVHPISLDVTDAAQRAAAVSQSLERFGRVDVLVNNAGGGVGGRIWVVGDADAAREAFETNYWSPLALARELVPAMRERGSGAVVNVTSMAQVNSWPGFGAYAATKGALAVATETLAMELAGSGVHVLEVVPGPVDTAVQGETRLAPGIARMLDRVPLGDARTLARLVVRALERGRSRLVYPRRSLVAYALPALIRRDTRRLAARAAAETPPEVSEALASLVVRTGSMGDEIARQARAAWEQQRGRSGG